MSVPEEASGTRLHSPPLPNTAAHRARLADGGDSDAGASAGDERRSTLSLPDPSPCHRAVWLVGGCALPASRAWLSCGRCTVCPRGSPEGSTRRVEAEWD